MASGSAFPGLMAAALFLPQQWACSTPSAPPEEDTGFYVASSEPQDRDETVVEAVNPELRLSRNADPGTCSQRNVFLLQVTDSGNTVTRYLDYQITFPDDGLKISMEPDNNLLPGFWYMLTVSTAADSCTDLDGLPIQPFSSYFYVP